VCHKDVICTLYAAQMAPNSIPRRAERSARFAHPLWLGLAMLAGLHECMALARARLRQRHPG